MRIGNGARDQIQLDTSGAMVDAAHLFEKFGGRLTLRSWIKLAHVIEEATTAWKQPDHGIWEPRHGTRHNVHSKLMNWLAMDRGVHIANAFGRQDFADKWKACAEEIHDEICAKDIDSTGRHFVSVYGEGRPDATLLLLPVHGFVGDSDLRGLETVSWVRSRLAEALALQGRLDEARDVFAAHTEASNHLGLLAEEIDPKTRVQLGNFPQAFSHLGLVNAALRIDLGFRLRDEGSARPPHLVGPISRRP